MSKKKKKKTPEHFKTNNANLPILRVKATRLIAMHQNIWLKIHFYPTQLPIILTLLISINPIDPFAESLQPDKDKQGSKATTTRNYYPKTRDKQPPTINR